MNDLIEAFNSFLERLDKANEMLERIAAALEEMIEIDQEESEKEN